VRRAVDEFGERIFFVISGHFRSTTANVFFRKVVSTGLQKVRGSVDASVKIRALSRRKCPESVLPLTGRLFILGRHFSSSVDGFFWYYSGPFFVKSGKHGKQKREKPPRCSKRSLNLECNYSRFQLQGSKDACPEYPFQCSQEVANIKKNLNK
jgi:hypothetical protein